MTTSIGASVSRHDAMPRPLTSGETALVNSIFGASLNTSKVRIYDRPYIPFQAPGVAMTPNGEVWFRPENYRNDFSLTLADSAWLIHELTHAWQFQTGRQVRLRGLYEQATRFIRDPYDYGTLDSTRSFASYLDEQQASIVSDYYLTQNRQKPRHGQGTLRQYQMVIPFLPGKPNQPAHR